MKYDESNIITLEGLEGVRKRPTIYLGDLSKGISQLFAEVIANALDEHTMGYGNKIIIKIDTKECIFSISDEGRGIPAGKLTDIFCKLHTGGKFNKKSYSFGSIGLNGCGGKVVNAVSEYTIVDTYRGNEGHYRQKFSKGHPITELKYLGETNKTGTRVIFKPDNTIFEDMTINKEEYIKRIETYSYLNPDLIFKLYIDDDKMTISSKNGLYDYLNTIPHSSILKKPIEIKGDKEYIKGSNPINMELDILIDYDNTANGEMISSFVNGTPTIEHGTHVSGVQAALTSFFNKYITDNKLMSDKSKIKITSDDVKECLLLIVSCKHSDPLYTSQTKEKLSNQDIQSFSRQLVNNGLKKVKKDQLNAISKLIINTAKGRIAAKNAKLAVTKIKETPLMGLSKFDKYTPCSSKKTEERTLYILEGASAAGSLIEARDPKTQAIYRLRGKPLNTHDKDINSILKNAEMSDISIILGTGIGKMFNYEKLRFNKIIIAADEDCDGCIIRSLMADFFLQHCPELIRKGHVFITHPPLYRISSNKGKSKRFISDKSKLSELITAGIIDEFNIKIGKRKLDKKALIDFFNITNQYLYELEKESSRFSLDIDLYEWLAILLYKYGDQYDKIIKILLEQYNELKLIDKKNLLLEGIVNNKYQIVRINDKEMLHSISSFTEYYIYNEGPIITMNGEKITYQHFLKNAFEKVFGKNVIFTRFKGVGSLEPEEIWETMLNPKTRTINKLIINNEDETLKVSEDLMGKDADIRKDILLNFKIKADEIDT